MSALLDRITNPQPIPMTSELSREAAAYDVSVTILQELGEEFTPLADHENLTGRVYPSSYGQAMAKFDTTRLITDRIKLVGYWPRINSSAIARVTDSNGESVMYDAQDVEHDGDRTSTTLIARRRGVDMN